MQARASWALAAAAFALTLSSCGTMMPGGGEGGTAGWTTLVDGTRGLDNFTPVGEANWSATDGAIQASAGGKDPAYLLSKQPYKDFMLRVEFWASDDANSGVFLRCQDPVKVDDKTCYEANIFDQRPDPTYATGAIVGVAKVPDPMPKAGGKWNVYEITAQGSHLVLVLNGEKTADVQDSKILSSGPIGLQWGRGTIKFRKVQIKPI
jgi:hypothetical protein